MILCTSVFCYNFSFFISNFIYLSLVFFLMTLANDLSFCLTSQKTNFWFYWSLLLSPSSLFHLLLSDLYALLLLTLGFFYENKILSHCSLHLFQATMATCVHSSSCSIACLAFFSQISAFAKISETTCPGTAFRPRSFFILACDTNRPSWGCEAPVSLSIYSDILDKFVRAQAAHL